MSDENAGHIDAGTPENPPATGGTAKADAAKPHSGRPEARARSLWQDSVHPAAKAAAARLASIVAAAARRVSGTTARLVRSHGLPRVAAAAAVLVVGVGLLAWLLASAMRGPAQPEAAGSSANPASSAPADRGQLPLAGVDPLDFRLGDCFQDFDPDAPEFTVVACETGHSAQLVAIEQYAAADPYPGRDKLQQRARDICRDAPLAPSSGDYEVSYKLAYPSSSSWNDGDRRVDCYAAAAGNVIKESLLP